VYIEERKQINLYRKEKKKKIQNGQRSESWKDWQGEEVQEERKNNMMIVYVGTKWK
jgi:hypothetical protein